MTKVVQELKAKGRKQKDGKRIKKMKKSNKKNVTVEDDPQVSNSKSYSNKKTIEEPRVSRKNEEESVQSDGSFNIDSYSSDNESNFGKDGSKTFDKKLKKKRKKKIAVEEDSESSSDSDDTVVSGDRSGNSDLSEFDMDSYPSDDETDEETKNRGKPVHSFPSKELDELESRTIFVGNLPKNIERDRLKKWFSRFGTVECVRLRCAPVANIEVPKKIAIIKKTFHEERSNISAYVRFKTLKSADNALQANGSVVDGHTIRVDHSVHKTAYSPKLSVFVGNVPFGAEEEGLRKLFQDCGDIESVRIIRDKTTGIGKGFAYVNFKCPSSVSLALKLNGHVFEKRELRINPVSYKANSKKSLTPQTTDRNNYSKTRPKKSFYPKFNKVNKFNKKKSDKFQGEVSQKKGKTLSKKQFIQQKKKEALASILTNKKGSIGSSK